MTDNVAHWALEDEELEALMIGATPEDLNRIGNPVAEFFVDARAARGVRGPSPDDSLRRVFANEGGSYNTAPAPEAPSFTTPAPLGGGFDEPTTAVGSGLFGSDALQPPPRPQVQPNPQAHASHQPPRPMPPEPVRPGGRPDPYSMDPGPVAGANFDPMYDATQVGQRPKGTLLSEHTAVHNRVQVPAYQEVYEPSPLDYMGQVIRPNGAKVLMGLAVVALFLTAGQMLGVISLFGGGGVDNQAVGDTDLSVSDAAVVSPDDTVDPSSTVSQPAVVPGQSTAVTAPLPDSVASPSVTETTAGPAETEPADTTTPTVSQTTTSTVEESSTTAEPSSTTTETSEPSTTETTNPSTTEPSTTETTEDSTTTEQPTTTDPDDTTTTTEKEDED